MRMTSFLSFSVVRPSSRFLFFYVFTYSFRPLTLWSTIIINIIITVYYWSNFLWPDNPPHFFEVTRLPSDTPYSVGPLQTSDRPVARTCTWQHRTIARARPPFPPVAFEPAIPASERPQTHALERAATGIGTVVNASPIFSYYVINNCISF